MNKTSAPENPTSAPTLAQDIPLLTTSAPVPQAWSAEARTYYRKWQIHWRRVLEAEVIPATIREGITVKESRARFRGIANQLAYTDTRRQFPEEFAALEKSKKLLGSKRGRPRGSSKTKAERMAAHRDCQAEYRRTERAKIQRKKQAAISAHRKAQAAKEARILRVMDMWNSRKSQVERVELDKELDREQKELLRQELYGQEASTDIQTNQESLEDPDITDCLRALGMRLRKAQGSEEIPVNLNAYMPVKVNCKEIGSDN